MKNYAAHLNGLDTQFHLHSQTDAVLHETHGALIITEGNGVFVKDVNDVEYLESMSALWYANLGFSNEKLKRAASNQFDRLPTYHTFNHRSNDACAMLSEKLANLLPMQDPKLFFVNSGSEAIDSMVKSAWYFHAANGDTTRRKIITRKGAFHGSSVFGAIVGGLSFMTDGFNLPASDTIVRVNSPCHYREANPGEPEDAYCDRIISEVEQVILEHGADTIAAMIAEPIMGAGGVLVPPANYFPRLSDLLSRHGILLLVDEVICGFGRTGEWFGSQTFGARPDMISMAKGITAGYFPMGAVAMTGEIYDALARQTHELGRFGHGFTYSGHPVASAVALAALEQYEEMDAPAVARARGQQLAESLENLASNDIVGDVRVRGFVAGVELVADKSSRVPFDPTLKIGRRFENKALNQGLIVRNLGDTISLCPPYIINDDEFGKMIAKFAATLTEVSEEVAMEMA